MEDSRSIINKKLEIYRKVSPALYLELMTMSILAQRWEKVDIFERFLEILERINLPAIDFSHTIILNQEIKKTTDDYHLSDENLNILFERELRYLEEDRILHAMGFERRETLEELKRLVSDSGSKFPKILVARLLCLLRLAATNRDN